MGRLIKKLREFFLGSNFKWEDKEVERKIVSRYGMSEPSLYFGRYVTTVDLERRRSSLEEIKFYP